MLIHHIGYYVTNLEESKNKFECMDFIVEKEAIYDKQRGIKVLFLIGASIRIELIEIVDKEYCEIAFMKNQKGAWPYHICYEVESIDFVTDKLKKQRFKVIRKKSKAIAIDNRDVVFLYNKSVGMIELIER